MKEKKKSWFRRHWVMTSALSFLSIVVIIGAFNSDSQTNNIAENAVREEVAKEDLPASYEEANQKAVDVSYEELMRYSESYDGKWVCFEGQVIQVISVAPNLELRVSTKEEEWIGYIDDIVYLYSMKDYSGERLLEKDIIQFCGISTGILTYDAIFGNQMSVPGINTNGPYIKRIS